MEQETMTPEKNERKGVLSRIRDRLMGSVSKNKPEETKASADLDMLLSTPREDDFELDEAFDRELEESLIASVEADPHLVFADRRLGRHEERVAAAEAHLRLADRRPELDAPTRLRAGEGPAVAVVRVQEGVERHPAREVGDLRLAPRDAVGVDSVVQK